MRYNHLLTCSALLLGIAALSRAARIFQDSRPSSASAGHQDPKQTSEETTVNPAEFAPTTNCPLCKLEKHPIRKSLTDTELHALRISIIKHDILRKLNLRKAPNITFPLKTVPQPLATEEFLNNPPSTVVNKDISDYYGKTTEVVLVGDIIPKCYGYKPSTCAFFKANTGSIDLDDVVSARLWVYKLPDKNDINNQTLVISELAAHTKGKYRSRRMVTHKTIRLDHGWVKFDIKNTLRRWIEKPKRNSGLRISCKTCRRPLDDGPVATKEELRPFIQVRMGRKDRRRAKRDIRSFECDPSMNKCCREQFYVTFAEIGYDWIIEPNGYFANYCRGSCASARESFLYTHSHVLHKVLDDHTKADFSPCCTPTRMSSLSVIYRAQSNVLVKKDIPNMRVEQCGCA